MNEVLSALIFKKQGFATEEKRTECHAYDNQSIRVDPTLQFSNQFIADLKRLSDLEPVLSVALLKRKPGIMTAPYVPV